METTTNTAADWPVKEAWLETVSGRRINLLDPDPDQIDIDDIAHGLALSCRWSGQCEDSFNIAQHSMGVAQIAESIKPGTGLQGLMHDAAEAILTDIPTPAKRIMPEYQKLEAIMFRAIAKKYGLPEELDEAVEKADRIMLMSERDRLKPRTKGGWGPAYEDAERRPGVIDHLITWNETWQQSKAHFLEAFVAYGGKV